MANFSTRTSNPVFNNDLIAGFDQVYGDRAATTMTVQGTIGKTSILLAILSATALGAWEFTKQGTLPTMALPVAGIAGFIVAMITAFKPNFAPFTAPIYAALEGVFLGALSYLIETRMGKQYPGIALQAVSLTVGVLFVMLFLYGSRIIVVTQRLRTGIMAATGALFLVYMGSFLLSMFGVQVPFLRNASAMGIGISLLVVGLAAFNLLLDFDFIERGSNAGAPKYMEWYGAFALVVTLVWLYLELLRLLSKLQSRN